MSEWVALKHIYHEGKDYKPGDEIEFGRDDRKIRELLINQGQVDKRKDWLASQEEAESELTATANPE